MVRTWVLTTQWQRPWCWERSRAEGEGGIRGWDGSTAPMTQRTWTWAHSRVWWGTGKPGLLQSVGWQSQRQLGDWTTTQVCRQLLEMPGAPDCGEGSPEALGFHRLSATLQDALSLPSELFRFVWILPGGQLEHEKHQVSWVTALGPCGHPPYLCEVSASGRPCQVLAPCLALWLVLSGAPEGGLCGSHLRWPWLFLKINFLGNQGRRDAQPGCPTGKSRPARPPARWGVCRSRA